MFEAQETPGGNASGSLLAPISRCCPRKAGVACGTCRASRDHSSAAIRVAFIDQTNGNISNHGPDQFCGLSAHFVRSQGGSCIVNHCPVAFQSQPRENVGIQGTPNRSEPRFRYVNVVRRVPLNAESVSRVLQSWLIGLVGWLAGRLAVLARKSAGCWFFVSFHACWWFGCTDVWPRPHQW